MNILDLGFDDLNPSYLTRLQMLAVQADVELPSDQELWEELRKSSKVPEVPEVFFQLSLEKICAGFKSQYPSEDFTYSTTNVSFQFLIHGVEIEGLADVYRELSSDD